MKEKKKIIFGMVLLFAIIFMVNLISASTIGGEVVSSDGIQAGWQKVFVYDTNDTNRYVEVYVSPENNRYSFSNVIDNGTIFLDSSVVQSEILDFQEGLMAGPVQMNLSLENNKYYSCTDCDIFPKMELREVIQFNEPIKQLYVSDDGLVNLDLNVYDDCDFGLFFEGNPLTYENFCEDGCDYRNTFEGNFGKNNWDFLVDCHVGKRIKGGSREYVSSTLGEYILFEKEMYYSNENSFFVNYYGEKSSGVNSIVDYIPDEFEVFNVSDGGRVYDEDGYYSIEWKNLSSSYFNFSYYIKPKQKLRSCEVGLTNDFVLIDPFSEKLNSFNDSFSLKKDNFYFDCNFSKNFSFFIVQNVEFEKVIEKSVKKGEEKTINLHGEISDNVSVEFKEYVPVEFEVLYISNNGKMTSSSSKYNVIVWEVNGDSFDFSYTIHPNVLGEFYLVSELGGEKLEETFVNVYELIPSLGKKSGGSGGKYKNNFTNYSSVSDKFPLIDKEGNLTVALYSNNFTNRGAFDLVSFMFQNKIYNRSLDYLGSYLLENNLGDNVKDFSFEFEFNETEFNKKYRQVEFYGVDNKGNFFKLNGNVVNEGETSKFSSLNNPFFSQVVMYGVKTKLNFWDRIVQWYWNVLGHKAVISEL
ncbi:hypothetical protein GW932_02420 [archaeon]|nr:hypothetical protein [archaeon]